MLKYALLAICSLYLVSSTAPNAAGAERNQCRDPKATIREGRRLYLESGCMSCHSVQGKGGEVGPPLDGIGKAHQRVYVEEKIRDPQAHPQLKLGKAKAQKPKPKSKMIQAGLFDDQIKALTDYLMSLPTYDKRKKR